MWGNAFRNPSCSLLMSHLKCVHDENGNAFCKRSYLSGIDVPASQADFEELSDTVKEFLSEVPNLYVEDAAESSGRLLEVRIRSITNDPATALAVKQVLVACRRPSRRSARILIRERSPCWSEATLPWRPSCRSILPGSLTRRKW